MRNEQPRQLCGQKVDTWEMDSEAWAQQLKRKLRVVPCERRYEAPGWKHERRTLRVATSVPVKIMPAGHGWKVGRCRFLIENQTFNVLMRDHHLTHNYRHNPAAIVALLALRPAEAQGGRRGGKAGVHEDGRSEIRAAGRSAESFDLCAGPPAERRLPPR